MNGEEGRSRGQCIGELERYMGGMNGGESECWSGWRRGGKGKRGERCGVGVQCVSGIQSSTSNIQQLRSPSPSHPSPSHPPTHVHCILTLPRTLPDTE